MESSALRVEWARQRGWVRVRDPFAGEWHEIEAQSIPGLARRAQEARETAGASRRKDKAALASELAALFQEDQ